MFFQATLADMTQGLQALGLVVSGGGLTLTQKLEKNGGKTTM